MRKTYYLGLLGLLFILLSHPLSAQQRARGRVLSAEGQPLEAASVVAGSSRTLSDALGRFDLRLAAGTDSISVSFTGYQAVRLRVSDSLPLVVTLQPLPGTLETVEVSTGYQQLPKERATGSFVKVNEALLNRSTGPDLLNRLKDVTSGLLFFKGPVQEQINIRGQATIFGDGYPLIVLDNFPYDGALSSINPNEIESVTVLRDAAAASIWGARAGNGVIVLTSKKAALAARPNVQFNFNTSLQGRADLMGMPQMAVTDVIGVETMLFDAGAYDALLANTVTRPAVTEAVEILYRKRTGALTEAEAAAALAALAARDARRDFERYVYRPAVHQQYALTVNGGTDKYRYLFSAGADRNAEELVGDQRQRLNFRLDQTVQLTGRLRLNVGARVVRSDGRRRSAGAYGAVAYQTFGTVKMAPYARLADADGTPLAIPRMYRLAYLDTVQSRLRDWRYRPLADRDETDFRERLNQTLLHLTADYRFSSVFSGSVQYRYEQEQGEDRSYYSRDSYFARDIINRFTQVTGTTVRYVVPNAGILDQAFSRAAAHSARAQLTAKAGKGPHHFNGIAGVELRSRETDLSSGRTYGFDAGTYTSAAVDLVDLYPTQLSFLSARVPNNTGFSGTLNRFTSVYTNIGYDYQGRYFLSASARKDASNIFGVRSNRKGTPLWSAGGKWLLSREAWFPAAVLGEWSLRSSYGFSGNLATSVPAVATISYIPATSMPYNLPAASLGNAPNPSLGWEKNGMWNIGLDLSTANQRISGSLDYFLRSTTDLLGVELLDPTTGIAQMITNSAHIRGRGFDVNLRLQPVRGKLNWDIQFLLSHSYSRVTRYLGQAQQAASYVGSGALLPIPGLQTSMVASYAWGGLDGDGDPVGFLKGAVSKDYSALLTQSGVEELVYHGPSVPPYFGGIRNDLRFGGWTFSMNVSYRMGYYFRRSALSYTRLFSQLEGHPEYSQRWQSPGDELWTNVPSQQYPANEQRDRFYALSAATVERGDQLRLSDLSLQYRVPVRAGGALRQLEVFGYGGNLNILLWQASRTGIDPDFPDGLVPRPNWSLGVRGSF